MQALFIGLAVLVLAVLFITRFVKGAGGKGTESHTSRIGDRIRKLNEDKRKYAVMTEALLMETENGSLLGAVLANLWAKMAPDLSDAHGVMSGLSKERQMIYALYAVTGSVNQKGFSAALSGEEGPLFSACGDALETIGAAQSAKILREGADALDPDVYTEAYLEAFEAEGGKAKMAAFVRENPSAFCDGEGA